MTIRQHFVDFIETRDHWLMRQVNGWRAPRPIRLWALYATRGGDGWLWYILGFFLMVFGGPERFAAVGASAAAASTGIALFLYVKRTARRRRPCTYQPHCWASLLPPDQFSFPSGHTIVAFACAMPIVLVYPGLGLGVLFCAFSIAASRVLLGMHFLSDVLAGGAIGSVLGYAAYSVFC